MYMPKFGLFGWSEKFVSGMLVPKTKMIEESICVQTSIASWSALRGPHHRYRLASATADTSAIDTGSIAF